MTNEFIVPTGRIVKEYLEEYQVSQKELSARIGVSEKHISNVLNGKTKLTEDMAIKLEKVLTDIPAAYWLNYEAKYREYIAREKEKNNLEKCDLQALSKRFHFKEVFKGMDISLVEQAIAMLKLLKISDFDNFDSAYQSLCVDFMEDGGEQEAIAIWLNMCQSEVEIQNNDLSSITYVEEKLLDSLELFKAISNDSDMESSMVSCRKLCNKLGIYLVVCDAISNSKVRGALTTYDDHPVIYLSGRFKTHDNIWFAFMHEIGHLIKHYSKQGILISFEELKERDSDKENEANEFARDFFIKPDDYQEFIINKDFTSTSIRQFAKKQNILPGIVVARLEHDKIIAYGKFSRMK